MNTTNTLYPTIQTQTDLSLNFEEIVVTVQSFCLAENSKAKIASECSTIDHSTIQLKYKQISELAELMRSLDPLPLYGVYDISDFLSKVHIENYHADVPIYLQIMKISENIKDIKDYFSQPQIQGRFLHLEILAKSVFYDQFITREISKIVDEKGAIRPSASPAYKTILEQKRTIHSDILKIFGSALQKAKNESWLHEIEQSMRHGRLVLAIKSEHKRAIKGVFHDESENGRIVYMEPNEMVHIQNEALEIEKQEEREIRKILIELTNKIRPYAALLISYQDHLMSWDCIYAKVKFMHLIQGSIPIIANTINVKKSRHPLLLIKNNKEKKTTIPFDLNILDKKLFMLSGPNAGGKSITLKALGLIARMVQSAMPIPAEADSEFPLYHQIIAEIGDMQSVDNELSTYSSKLVLWKSMVKISDQKTLLLLDELGDGTDPSFGAGMAQSFVESCLKNQATIIATTHYSDLKKMSESRPDALSGSMLFDESKLEPTFQLIVDKPGSSYTFHIAQKVGLPDHIIQRAKQLSEKEQVKYEAELIKLEKKERELRQRSSELERMERELKKQMKEWNKLHLDLDLSRKKVRYEKMVHSQEIESLKASEIRAFREELKNKERDKLLEEQRAIEKEKTKQIEESNKLYKAINLVPEDYPFREGEHVRYIATHAIGIIEKIKNGKATVLFDHIKSTISLKDLIPVETQVESKRKSTKLVVIDKTILRELDLRGKFVHEAIQEIDEYINKSILANYDEVKIVHGVGKLKTEVLKVLKTYRVIRNIQSGIADQGGAGVSIIKF